MKPPALAVLIVTLGLMAPGPLNCQGTTNSTLLRYKAQPEPLHYQVTIATEYRVVAASGTTGRWDATHSIYDDVVLEMEEEEEGILSGTYDLGTVQNWTRRSGVQSGGVRQMAGQRSDRITRFEMDGTGDVGVMGDRIKALAGEEIFRRLWQVPHLLPEGSVEVGRDWLVDRSLTMAYSHSTEIDAEYRVVEILDQDVWVAFSGNVMELLSQSRSGQATHGTFTGRFGFRPSIGAMVAVEWDYDYKTGNPDRPWEYTETREEGSMVLQGLAEDLPVEGVTRVIPENRNNRGALAIAGILIAVGLGIVLGAGGG